MSSIKAIAAKIFAKIIRKKMRRWIDNPIEAQAKVFDDLIEKAKSTKFGQDHNFSEVKTHSDFIERVPVMDYEGLKKYTEKMLNGDPDVLWPGRPTYYAKTSGTTSGAKFIPITEESMPSHIHGARNAILNYIAETGKTGFVDGKMIFLQGSPVLKKHKGVKTGRLSGIVAHFVPAYLQKNRMPSWQTNTIDDWEEKVEAVIEETLPENMTVISGIPSWVQMYFEKIKSKTKKDIGQVFPNFNLFIYGGVNFEPYRNKFRALIGRKVDSIEIFPASEGFFAFQDEQDNPGLLLRLDAGIFYEFIKVSEFYDETPERHTLETVEKNVNYVLIISTNAGLWAYNLGDTIQFVSLKPFRVIVSGRLKHFISAFGEHVIASEVEGALKNTLKKHPAEISEFSVAPKIEPEIGLPFHEWFIEFDQKPDNFNSFVNELDDQLQQKNAYYQDLIKGKILRPLLVSEVEKNGFQKYMKSIGKLGGQNKIPRLTNDRKLAEKLIQSGVVIKKENE
jgi:hypothetical protein